MTLIAMIAFVYLFFFLIRKHPTVFWTIFITSIVVSIFTLVSNRFIFPRFFRAFSFLCGTHEVAEEWIIYDTDPRNDVFIKGRLQYRELKMLDRVLLYEKNQNDGMRLDTTTLNEYANYDPKIIDAYDRWRKCSYGMTADSITTCENNTFFMEQKLTYKI